MMPFSQHWGLKKKERKDEKYTYQNWVWRIVINPLDGTIEPTKIKAHPLPAQVLVQNPADLLIKQEAFFSCCLLAPARPYQQMVKLVNARGGVGGGGWNGPFVMRSHFNDSLNSTGWWGFQTFVSERSVLHVNPDSTVERFLHLVKKRIRGQSSLRLNVLHSNAK